MFKQKVNIYFPINFLLLLKINFLINSPNNQTQPNKYMIRLGWVHGLFRFENFINFRLVLHLILKILFNY